MDKQRLLLLPAGGKVDNSNPKKWVFPVGTVFVKTFFDDGGPGGKSRPVETRFIRRVGDQGDLIEYDYYLYQWTQDATDATLLLDDMSGDPNLATPVPVTIKRTVDGQALHGERRPAVPAHPALPLDVRRVP